MSRKHWSTTGRRLFVAFSAFIALYALASGFALVGLVQIRSDLVHTRARVEGMRVALDLASAVRDQYAHLAHTIILGNESHVDLHTQATARVLALVAVMRQRVEGDEELALVAEIEAATRELGTLFHDRIVPEVVTGDSVSLQADHHRALAIVARIQVRTDLLAQRFASAVEQMQVFVGNVERRAFIWTLLFLFVAPLVAAAVGITIGRSVTLAVTRLQAGAESLALGNLDTQIVLDTQDEFGALARQFNSMTSALREHQRQLVHNERLASIGRLAAGVAHEINNPLGVILGYTRILRKTAVGGLGDDLRIIEDETLRCKDIVQGLLDLARPQQLRCEVTDLRELCLEVINRLSESHATTALQISVLGEATLTCDTSKLRQIVLNLAKNAIEASGPEGRVEIELKEMDHEITLTVTDSGAGVSAAMRDTLFEPFRTTKARGTGLGLAVSQAIARAHGGEITFVGGAPQGARFVLRLPRTTSGSTT